MINFGWKGKKKKGGGASWAPSKSATEVDIEHDFNDHWEIIEKHYIICEYCGKSYSWTGNLRNLIVNLLNHYQISGILNWTLV
jgi:uncharacterized Zn-finger protein